MRIRKIIFFFGIAIYGCNTIPPPSYWVSTWKIGDSQWVCDSVLIVPPFVTVKAWQSHEEFIPDTMRSRMVMAKMKRSIHDVLGEQFKVYYQAPDTAWERAMKDEFEKMITTFSNNNLGSFVMPVPKDSKAGLVFLMKVEWSFLDWAWRERYFTGGHRSYFVPPLLVHSCLVDRGSGKVCFYKYYYYKPHDDNMPELKKQFKYDMIVKDALRRLVKEYRCRG